MARVLWVSAEVPHHTGWGGPIRQAHLLDGLARRADVDLLVTGEVTDPRVRAACRTVTELSVPPLRPETRARRWARSLRPTSPPEELELARGRCEALAAALPSPVTHDVVLVQHNELVPLLPPAGAPRGARWVLDLHHLLSVRHAHEAHLVGGRRGAYHRIEAWRGRRLERDAVRRVDRVLVCSPADATVLGGQAIVVPNGVDVDAVVPTPVPTAPRVVFTGHLSYTPNTEGVRWLAREVLPTVRSRVPDVQVDVVGRTPLDEVRDLVAATPGMALHPDVPSVAPYLAAARVAVVPVHIGSGTRLKALDAMAAGRPVVGTTIGLEGLDVVHGHDAMVADDPTAFADALVRVLDDDVLACELAGAGRATAERFGWGRLGEQFAHAMLDAGVGP